MPCFKRHMVNILTYQNQQHSCMHEETHMYDIKVAMYDIKVAISTCTENFEIENIN